MLLRKGDRFLSVSRKDDPNAYGLPGGKQEKFETSEEAARRECYEETGLGCGDLKFLYAGKCEGGKDGKAYWTTTYVGDYTGSVNTEETGVVRWVSVEDLLDGPFADYNRRLFDTLGLL